MSRLTWDQPAVSYEMGVDRGVFYLPGQAGVPWNGLVSVTEEQSESEERARYFDGVRIQGKQTRSSFAAVVQAFTYPVGFESGVAMGQRKRLFDFSYRVRSSDTYKIHLVYNALATPTPADYLMDETTPLSWSISTKPRPIFGLVRSAHLVVDSGIAYSSAMDDLENILYGSESSEARMPSPEEIIEIFEVNSILRVVDNGDGTFTVTGPDTVIQMLDATTFEITWPSAVYIDEVTYTLESL